MPAEDARRPRRRRGPHPPARRPGPVGRRAGLREALDNLGVHGWQRWKRLILPAVFPSYVTGGITASGGARNASIVAEILTYGGTTLTATGLGAHIAAAIESGDFHHILAGVVVMSFYIVGPNRLLWRRLYRLAENALRSVGTRRGRISHHSTPTEPRETPGGPSSRRRLR